MRSLFTGRMKFLGYVAAFGVASAILFLAVRSPESRKSLLWLLLAAALVPTFASMAVGQWKEISKARKSGFASLPDAIGGWLTIGWDVMWFTTMAAGTILGIVLFFGLLSDMIFGWPHFYSG